MDGFGSKQDFGGALLELQLRMQGGERPEDAIAFLESRGMPKNEARLTVHRIVARSVKEQRTKGAFWLGLSAVCPAIASPFAIALFSAYETGSSARGLRRGVVEASALPVLLLIAGVWLGYRGLKLVLSRRYAGDPDR